MYVVYCMLYMGAELDIRHTIYDIQNYVTDGLQEEGNTCDERKIRFHKCLCCPED